MLMYVVAGVALLAYIASYTAVAAKLPAPQLGGCSPLALEEPRIGDRTTPRATCSRDNCVISCSVRRS
jgi:hypothetical protein